MVFPLQEVVLRPQGRQLLVQGIDGHVFRRGKLVLEVKQELRGRLSRVMCLFLGLSGSSKVNGRQL
jgi:hypothetical protein